MTEFSEVISEESVLDMELKCPFCGTTFKPAPEDIHRDSRGLVRARCPNSECKKSFVLKKEIATKVEKMLQDMGIELPKIDDKEKGGQEVAEVEEETPEDLIMQYGMDGLYTLMERELVSALRELPKPPSVNIIKMIVNKFRNYEWYKTNAYMLYTLLQSYVKASPHLLQDIVFRVFDIPRRYENVVRMAMQYNPELFTMRINVPAQPQPSPMPILSYISSQAPTPRPNMMYFDLRQWLAQLAYGHSYEMPNYEYRPTAPHFGVAIRETDREDSKYITKDELKKFLDDYFRKKEEEEKERKLYDMIEGLAKRVNDLEDVLKKNWEEGEEESEEGGDILDFVAGQLAQLQSQLNELRSRIEGGGSKSAVDELLDLARKINELKGLLGIREEVPKEITERLNKLAEQVERLTGEIKPENLRLQELQTQKEIKELEIQGLKEMVDRAAQAIENAPAVAAQAFGYAMAAGASQPSTTNIVVVGNEIKAVCPKCGAEYSKPLGSKKIDCPVCGFVLFEAKESQSPTPEKKEGE